MNEKASIDGGLVGASNCLLGHRPTAIANAT